MKMTKVALSIVLIGAFTLGVAEDVASVTDTTLSVDAQIEAIQAAPSQERVELMNEFKQRLMQMNEEDRMVAIQEMQSKMQAEAGDAHELGTSTAAMTQNMARKRVQNMQMQTNEQISYTQSMTQQQGTNQFMQAGSIPSHAPSMNTDMMQRR